MADYSFMKTGLGDDSQPLISLEMLEEVNIMVSYLTSNAMLRASEYVAISNRDLITRDDLIMGMKYEAITMMKNPNFEDQFSKYKEDYLKELYEESEEEELNLDFEEEEEIEYQGCTIVKDGSIKEPFTRISLENQKNLTDKEKRFVSTMHNCTDHWDQFKPNTFFQKSIKNTINTINRSIANN